MRTALDSDAEKLDEDELTFVNIIREHGWHRMSVSEDEEGPGFSYTTGFWLAGFPEIIIFAMKPEIASGTCTVRRNQGKAIPKSQSRTTFSPIFRRACFQ
jgi:Domain of unknown function (DUF4262)